MEKVIMEKVRITDIYYCSECGRIMYRDDRFNGRWWRGFCKVCGPQTPWFKKSRKWLVFESNIEETDVDVLRKLDIS